jgi:hypothetical protein
MNNEGVESGVLLGKTAEKISGPTQGR